jgi:hypothetical protein
MPRKEFESFTRLDASDVNTFLMDQSVMTFADTAARGSAIATPVEGMVTYLEDSNSFEYWDSAEWDSLVPPSPSGNFLINGAMQVAQRGTSVTGITAGGYITADRWQVPMVTMGTWTNTIENDAPSGSGFRNSWKILCTTADASPAAADQISIRQLLEGQNLQSILKGTSSAKNLTLSFWVKSNVTGTYITALTDSDNSRQVSASYTIDSSGSWEKKTITFPADTTGVLDNDNQSSLFVRWWLGAGSNFTSGTLRTAWTSTVAADLAVGQVNLAADTNNYWQITGVQLELGNVASDFDFQDIQSELAACQRYYQRVTATVANQNLAQVGFAATAAIAFVGFALKTSMRVLPNVSVDFAGLQLDDGSAATAVTGLTLVGGSGDAVMLRPTVASGLTQFRPYILTSSTTTGFVGVSAEL